MWLGCLLVASIAALLWLNRSERGAGEMAQSVAARAALGREAEPEFPDLLADVAAASGSEDQGPVALAVPSLGWLDRGHIIDERWQWNVDRSLARRLVLVDVPDLGYPVRVEQLVRKTGDSHVAQILGQREMAAHRVLARAPSGASLEQLQELAAAVGLGTVRSVGSGGWHEIELRALSLEAVPEALSRLAPWKQPEGGRSWICAEPDYIALASLAPNDERFLSGEQWGLSNDGRNGGVAAVDIAAEAAWDIRSNAEALVVAVIDSGVDLEHEDLRANLWLNEDEIPGNGIDDDANGYVDDVHGIDAAARDSDPSDSNGHGTHSAGTIGAVGNNRIGTTGVAWQARIMPLKFISSKGAGAVSDAVELIDYAIDNGARVLSNSWGTGAYSQALADAAQRAAEREVVLVASAGNFGKDADLYPNYPASFEHANIVSVAAMRRDGGLASFSNYGRASVDLAAPGESILSTWGGEGEAYKELSGTSMAVPFVSGAVALAMAEYPEDGAVQQVNRLMASVERRDGLKGFVGTGGSLNLQKTLAREQAPNPPRISKYPQRRYALRLGDALVLEVETIPRSDETYAWYHNGQELIGETGKTLRIESLALSQAGDYRFVASNPDGNDSLDTEVQVRLPVASLGVAFGASEFDFYTCGDGDWRGYAEDDASGDGVSLRSGDIGDDAASGLFTVLSGPGEARFAWKLSADAPHDFGRFEVDGETVARLESNGDWTTLSYFLEEAKEYRLDWIYEKDGFLGLGLDALLLDAFAFTPSASSPPVIKRQAQGASVAAGATYTLSVEAFGEGIAYQWFQNGSPLAGKTEPQLVLSSFAARHEGSYQVELTNQVGTTRSASVSLSLSTKPASIVAEPLDEIVTTGAEVLLRVAAEGAYPISYQWYKDDVLLEGQTGSSLRIPASDLADQGVYRARVSNAFNLQPEWSRYASLQVVDVASAPLILRQPESVNVESGKAVVLDVLAEGARPMRYQWFKDGELMEGSTSPRLEIVSAALVDAGSYFVEVSNSYGATLSLPCEVSVYRPFGEALEYSGAGWTVGGRSHFVAQSDETYDGEDALRSQIAPSGKVELAQFSTVVEGPGNLLFYWKQSTSFASQEFNCFVDGRRVLSLVGERDWQRGVATLSPGKHQVSWFYSYSGNSIAWIDQVAVTQAPVILSSPEDVVRELGESFSLEVEASGVGVLSYQWFQDGELIEGATGARLEVADCDSSHRGLYRVVASNEYGSEESREVRVEVLVDGRAAYVSEGSEPWSALHSGSWRLGLPDQAGDGVALGIEAGLGGTEPVELSFEGPANLGFSWRIDSEKFFTGLALEVDGAIVWSAVGDSGGSWKTAAVRVDGAGPHVARWNFVAQGGGAEAAWIDELLVTTAPLMARHPQGARKLEGAEHELTAQAVGSAALSYQWLKDGVELAGKTAPSLRLSSLQASDAGAYQCRASDGGLGSVLSETAEVDVVSGLLAAVEAPSGSFAASGAGAWEPQGVVSHDGQDALAYVSRGFLDVGYLRYRFNHEIGSVGTFRFWMKVEGLDEGSFVRITANGLNGQTVYEDSDWRMFEFPATRASGNEIRWQMDRYGPELERPLRVWIDAFELDYAPVDYGRPRLAQPLLGGPADLSSSVLGATSLVYAWEKSGEPLVGASDASLSLGATKLDSPGVYRASVSNGFGGRRSSPIELSLGSELGESVGAPGLGLWSDGQSLWASDEGESRLGERSLKAHGLAAGEESNVNLRIQGPGELRFHWKLNARGPDEVLRLFLNGVVVASLDESRSWVEESVSVPSGANDLRWSFSKSGSLSPLSGEAWLDGLRYIPSGVYTYARWRSQQVDPISKSPRDPGGPFEDPDGDGMANFVEFALLSQPFQAGIAPRPSLDWQGERVEAEATLLWRKNLSEVGFAFMISEDLESWRPIYVDRETAIDLGSFQALTLRYADSGLNPTPTLFARLAFYYLDGNE